MFQLKYAPDHTEEMFEPNSKHICNEYFGGPVF